MKSKDKNKKLIWIILIFIVIIMASIVFYLNKKSSEISKEFIIGGVKGGVAYVPPEEECVFLEFDYTNFENCRLVEAWDGKVEECLNYNVPVSMFGCFLCKIKCFNEK